MRLSAAGFALLAACQSASPQTRPAAPVVTVPRAQSAESDGAAPPARASTPAEAPSEASICEQYLEYYARCEPKLQADIASGNLRTARVERGRIEHLRKYVVDPAELEAACQEFQRELAPRCGK